MKRFLATAVAVTMLVLSLPFLYIIWLFLRFAETFSERVDNNVRKP